MKNYTIITCDGGGFLGVITASLLDDLESSFPGILENVGLFGGTSTGAIITLGLGSRRMTTKDLLHFYETAGPQVFQRCQPSSGPGARPNLSEGLHRMLLCRMVPELCYPVYTNEGQIEVLEPYFGDATFADLKTNVLVTTFAVSNSADFQWEPLALHSLPGTHFSNVSLLDAVMCSSSPPALFPPYFLPTEPERWCVDGGVFANNPSTFTIAHLINARVLEAEGKTHDNLRLLSIGTGARRHTVPFNTFGDPFNWGIYRWMNPYPPAPEAPFPLLAAVWDGQSEVDSFQSRMILGEDRYRRANPVLPESVRLDDWQAVPKLEEWTQEYIVGEEWQAVKQWVKENFV